MKKALVVVALLGVVAVASADLDIYFTPASAGYGLTDPGSAFKPVGGTYALRGGTTPPVPTTPPLGMVNETCYLWVHFDGDEGAKIQALHLYVGGAPVGENAYYLLDDPAWFDKRWDGGCSPGCPEYKMNPQVLVGVTAYGIQNKAGTDPLWHYPEHTALLGAFRFSGVGTAIPELGSLGVSYKGGTVPNVRFTGIIIPEPAGLLLLGLAGLLMRRR